MVVHTDGGETKFEEVDYASCRITFSNGRMVFHVGDAVKQSFDIMDIRRVSFYGVRTGVAPLAGEPVVTYSAVSETLQVYACPGTSVTVYHLNGARALSRVQTIASSSVSVAHLPAGMYVAVVGSETLKFVKQ